MLYQEHKLKTNIILSEKIIQGLELLTASLEEIIPLIRQEVIENPIFDLEKFQDDCVIEQTISNSHQSYLSKETNKQAWWENIPEDNSILSQLKQTSKQFFHDPIDVNIVEHIIGSLNKNGCLDCSLEEIAILTETNISKVKIILSKIQKIFPLGIASLNLKQSVLIQLKEQNQHKLAYQIIEQYFDNDLKCDINNLCKKTYLTTEELQKLLHSALNSISFYSIEQKNSFYNKTILPDVIANYKNKQWNILINQSPIPSLNTNEKYLNYLKSNNVYLEKFIRTKFIKAKNLIDNIEKRKQTLTMIFSYIIHFHTDFLLGFIKNPSSLTMKEISSDLSLHISTISRALKNKTLMCNGSIISIKQLVTSHIFNNQETLSSSNSIKQFIKELIDKEDLNKPLSDKEISEKISSLKNVICSRRTIAKYRTSLGIPSTFKRKKYLCRKVIQNKKNITVSNAN